MTWDKVDEDYYGQSRVCSITPTEFELYCMEILRGYAEKERLCDFTIQHNVKLAADDSIYQIDVYATYTALGSEMKILAECKQYKDNVAREKAELLASRLHSLGAQKGILLSTAGFQSGTIQFAEKHGIALVQVFDTHEKWYSHSGGPDEIVEEDDPIVYGERHMPRYIAQLITSDSTQTIYPTIGMISEIYKKMDELSQKKYGLTISVNTEERGENL